MRIAVQFQLDREATLPVNHQDLLTGLVYRLLGASDAEYARFLHDEGYGLPPGPSLTARSSLGRGTRQEGSACAAS